MLTREAAKYNMAGTFMILSGILHLPLFVWGGMSAKVIFLTVAGVIWMYIGISLRGKKTGFVWFAFIAMLVGMVASMLNLNVGPGPNWLWYLIFLADLMAALFLFQILWAKKTP